MCLTSFARFLLPDLSKHRARASSGEATDHLTLRICRLIDLKRMALPSQQTTGSVAANRFVPYLRLLKESSLQKKEGVSTCWLTPLSQSYKQTSMSFSLTRSISLNNGQDQMRGMRTVMIDAVDRLHKILLGFSLNRSTSIRVA